MNISLRLQACLLALSAVFSITSFEVAQAQGKDAEWFTTQQAIKSDCGKVSGPVAWSYCVTTTPGSSNMDVVYLFHGGGGNEKAWTENKWLKPIRTQWSKLGVPMPRVVTVSFGGYWLLAEKNSKPGSGLYEYFVHSVMPAIESRLSPKVGSRYLLGYSMGGFSAAVLMIKNGELFKKAVLLCPAFANISPYAPAKDVQAYIKRTNASSMYVKGILKVAQTFFPDDQSWKAGDPMNLIQKVPGSKLPPFQISCGDQDDFGFQEGSERFARLAKASGGTVQWALLKGDHCTIDAPSVAAYLSK